MDLLEYFKSTIIWGVHTTGACFCWYFNVLVAVFYFCIICTFISRVCAVAQYAVLEASSQWDRRNFEPLPLPNPRTNLDAASNISLRPPRESMCKIWLKSIQPLPLCACVKKRGLAWVFFVYISIRRSVYPFFATPTGHIFSAILKGHSGAD